MDSKVRFFSYFEISRCGEPTNEKRYSLRHWLFFSTDLLSGTLRTIQRAACDGEMLTLRCPLGTAVSIQLAQYGRPAPGVSLCSEQKSPDSPVLSSFHGNQLQQQQHSDNCTLTPQMQVLISSCFVISIVNWKGTF